MSRRRFKIKKESHRQRLIFAGSSWRTERLWQIVTSRRNPPCIWFFVCEVVCRSLLNSDWEDNHSWGQWTMWKLKSKIKRVPRPISRDSSFLGSNLRMGVRWLIITSQSVYPAPRASSSWRQCLRLDDVCQYFLFGFDFFFIPLLAEGDLEH